VEHQAANLLRLARRARLRLPRELTKVRLGLAALAVPCAAEKVVLHAVLRCFVKSRWVEAGRQPGRERRIGMPAVLAKPLPPVALLGVNGAFSFSFNCFYRRDALSIP
jgi:hypothetical protein